MFYRTPLDKVNTIISDSPVNVGISPICELIYGEKISRLLIHFNTHRLEQLVNEKEIADIDKCKHTLRLYNCGKFDKDGELYVNTVNMITAAENHMRAAAFDLIAFKLPKPFGKGNGGYDFKKALYCPKPALAYNGATWFNNNTGKQWDEAGVYTIDRLYDEYDAYHTGQESVIVAQQHFPLGNEPIELDITDYVNNILRGEQENYGLGICYAPWIECLNFNNEIQYCSFYTPHTNTFFKPVLETHYNERILDTRDRFYANRVNRLYLYCNIDGNLENLDELPTTSSESFSNTGVQQACKGVYYVETSPFLTSGLTAGEQLDDIWGNIVFNNVDMEPVEQDFVVRRHEDFFKIGRKIEGTNNFHPQIASIKDQECIIAGDKRRVEIINRVPYTRNENFIIDDLEIRLYVKDGGFEFDVIPYDKVNIAADMSFYDIDTINLEPNKYYIDIKARVNNQEIIHHEVVSFFIFNNITEKYKNNV